MAHFQCALIIHQLAIEDIECRIHETTHKYARGPQDAEAGFPQRLDLWNKQVRDRVNDQVKAAIGEL